MPRIAKHLCTDRRVTVEVEVEYQTLIRHLLSVGFHHDRWRCNADCRPPHSHSYWITKQRLDYVRQLLEPFGCEQYHADLGTVPDGCEDELVAAGARRVRNRRGWRWEAPQGRYQDCVGVIARRHQILYFEGDRPGVTPRPGN